MGCGWFVGAKIKDQQVLMIDRVREGERYSERFYNGGYHLLWQPPRKLGKGWGDKQEVTQ